MEEEGIVSIWLGNFEDKEALAAYAEARFQKDEDGNTVPSFTQDFFNGDLWPFEPDVFDYEMTTASQDPATVAEPLGEALAASLAELYSKGFDQSYNAIIAVYDYQFEGSRYVPGAPVRFIASLSYLDR
ncbi:immunity 22 family protein [uncultured Oscillibacter sp.]|uniref:immunity 22 family protein n=1 Tax=uncultured Oscillibacter sp. TaxID=876091 RepID=UPI0025EE644A|nr:immunity 22 family protein [uncultured Oscillibacter sp.]